MAKCNDWLLSIRASVVLGLLLAPSRRTSLWFRGQFRMISHTDLVTEGEHMSLGQLRIRTSLKKVFGHGFVPALCARCLEGSESIGNGVFPDYKQVCLFQNFLEGYDSEMSIPQRAFWKTSISYQGRVNHSSIYRSNPWACIEETLWAGIVPPGLSGIFKNNESSWHHYSIDRKSVV